MAPFRYFPLSLYLLIAIVFPQQSRLLASDRTEAIRHQCGADIIAQELLQERPERQQLGSLIDEALFHRISTHTGKTPMPLDGDAVYSIPVVVHIVHDGGEENISDSQVLEGISHINAAFAKLRLDASSTVSFVLCMARQDEEGMLTNGITRTQAPMTTMTIESDDRALKDLIRWNPGTYLNIWIVRDITSLATGSDIAAYTAPLSSHGAPEDGIVVEARYFGSSPVNSTVPIHEVGHYLGLYHTFHGGCGNNNCLLDGDHVCDTPPDATTAVIECTAPLNSCLTDPDDLDPRNPFRPVLEGGTGDQPDMLSNFMDYGDIACRREFTPGQAQRMLAVLLEVRKSLLASPGCADPCPSPIALAFSADKDPVIVGETVTFTSTGTGADSYIWRVDNTTIATSENASYVFPAPGIYVVSVEASNGDTRCTAILYDTVDVLCGVRAAFTADKVFINPGDEVQFANTSTGAEVFTWFVDDQQRSATTNYSEIFTSEGGHTVMLVATNGICSDTAYAFINVGSCAGREANIWYFGDYSGLNFSTGTPTVLSNGQLTTIEGCATICNSAGQLLFYTEGYTVWDRHHNIMPGGAGTLGGHFSSTQSAIIVPAPGKPGVYYIFTVDALENLYANGLSYAIVDMARNNGAGEVTSVVKQLKLNVGEKLTVARHSSADAYWVIVRGFDDKFYSYLVSGAGIAPAPVVSTVSRVYNSDQPVGVMKVSSQNNSLALANHHKSEVEVYPFNAATGAVSEAGSYVLSSIQGAYGLEFSPDGSYLYASQPVQPAGIYQYNLKAGSPEAVQASAHFIKMPDTYEVSGLQLAIDGRIYVSRYDAPGLGAIRQPDRQGEACDYRDNIVTLPNPARYGLPSFIQTFLQSEQTPQLAITGAINVCAPTTASYTLPGSDGKHLRWIHRGGGTLSVSGDSKTASIEFSTPGIDTLTVFFGGRCTIFADTIFITSTAMPELSLGPDIALCNDLPVVLDAGGGFTSYRWQDGSQGRTLQVQAPGSYWVTAVSPAGCELSDTVVVSKARTTPPDLGPDRSTCTGSVFVFDAGDGFASYRWQDGSSDRQFTAYQTGTYWVEVETYCGDTMRDTVAVQQEPLRVPVSNDTTICLGTSVRLSADTPALSFQWSPATGLDNPSSASPIASPLQTTVYTVRCISTNGCSMENSVTVSVDTASLQLSADTTICPGGTARLSVFTPAISYEWSPATGLDDPTSPSPVASPSATTTYRVQCVSPDGCVMEDGVTVGVYDITPQVSPDTAICPGGTARLAITAPASDIRWSPATGLDDPTSPSPVVSPLATTTYSVHYTSEEGCAIEGEVTVTVLDKTPVALYAPDTVVTPGSQLLIPLYIDVAPHLLPLHIPLLTFSVRYNVSLFKTTGLTTGSVDIGRSGSDETAFIEVRDVVLTDRSTLLTSLVGTVFLGDRDSTTLTIENPDGGICIAAMPLNGSLTPSGVCNIDIRRVRLRDMTATTLAVAPNPAADAAAAEITTSEEGTHTLSIYNLQGQLLWQDSFVHKGTRSAHLVSLKLRDIPAGLYQVVLGTPSQTITTTLSVVQ